MFHVELDAALPDPVVVSRETRAQLDLYAGLILDWSKTINLVSRASRSMLGTRHIEDCLQLASLTPPAGEMIDFGSGAGLPGLVLAIATGRHVHLVEADLRKAAFLREASRMTGATVSIHAQRVEDATLPPAALITARAVAPLRTLLALAQPRLAPGGFCLFPKGRGAMDELVHARLDWQMNSRLWQSRTDQAGLILQISGLSRCG